MTSVQIKAEIQKVLDEVPEDVLIDILDHLKQIQQQASGEIKLAKNLKKILAEDRELLERLAQ